MSSFAIPYSNHLHFTVGIEYQRLYPGFAEQSVMADDASDCCSQCRAYATCYYFNFHTDSLNSPGTCRLLTPLQVVGEISHPTTPRPDDDGELWIAGSVLNCRGKRIASAAATFGSHLLTTTLSLLTSTCMHYCECHAHL